MDFDQTEAKYPGERYQTHLGLLLYIQASGRLVHKMYTILNNNIMLKAILILLKHKKCNKST